MTPDTRHYLEVIEATWPCAGARRLGPWTIRDGQGGGKRVSAATAEAAVTPQDLPRAEAAMRALGQVPLILVRPGEEALDILLAAQGYRVIDPVAIHAAPVQRLASEPPPPVTTWCIWKPLAIMDEIWEEAGVTAARRAVMARAVPPKTAILGRLDQQAAAVGFVGLHGQTAMMHALAVREGQRRAGMGRHLMRTAAIWAAAQGATRIATLSTRANAAAGALYASLGMEVVGQYHYRQHPEGEPR